MFIAALLIIANMWKQPNCSSTKEWIKKMWCVYVLKEWNNAICRSMDGPRDDHTDEVCQKEIDKHHMISHIVINHFSHVRLYDTMDCSLPDSAIVGRITSRLIHFPS